MVLRPAVTLLSLLLSACGSQPMLIDSGSRVDAIFGGTPAPDDEGVVGLALDSSGYVCTGTLIRPNVVLTAAHCLNGREDGWPLARAIFGANLDATSTVSLGDHVVHSGYNGSTKQHDIGLVRLAGPAPVDPVPELQPAAALSFADEGHAIRFVGYGRTETEPTRVKREVTITLDLLCRTSGCSFESVPIPSGSFAYDQTNGGPCVGDSGGPALLVRGTTEFVVGITAAGDAECIDYGISTTVDRHRDLIEEFVTAVPIASQCAGYDGPTGDPCETSVDCGLLSCLDEDSFAEYAGGYCSIPCAGENGCPSDSLCADHATLDGPHCLLRCTGDCRAGYSCETFATGDACVPVVPVEPDGGPPGDPSPQDDGAASPGDVGGGDPLPGDDVSPDGVVSISGGCACRNARGGTWWLLTFFLVVVAARRRRGG